MKACHGFRKAPEFINSAAVGSVPTAHNYEPKFEMHPGNLYVRKKTLFLNSYNFSC